jgi:hypothetical protein
MEHTANTADLIFFPWPPFFLCVGHVIELSLKAYLIARASATERDLRAIGHDLNKALEKARKSGLRAPAENVQNLIAKIAPAYEDHLFRYLRPMDVEKFPDINETLTATETHFLDLADQLRELLPPNDGG